MPERQVEPNAALVRQRGMWRAKVRALAVGAVVIVASATLAGCGTARAASSGRGFISPPVTAPQTVGTKTGSGTGTGSGGGAGSLCASIDSLDRLVVTRSDAFPGNHLRFSFPSVVTVSNPHNVRAAARAVCSLPPMPSGVFNCPADLGVDYGLSFAAGARRFATVTVDATGCETVEHLGATRWIARTPGFFTALGAAMGLAGANGGTFAGSGPGG